MKVLTHSNLTLIKKLNLIYIIFYIALLEYIKATWYKCPQKDVNTYTINGVNIYTSKIKENIMPIYDPKAPINM